MPVLTVAMGALGLLVGSFLNVVVHRIPRSESLVRPGSRCPSCEHPIRFRHNVPVLGWLVLRGRCADCSAGIPVRYPAVELLTSALFVAVTLWLAQVGLLSALPAFLWFVSVGICLALIDLDTGRLPDAIVLPTYPVLAALLTLSALVAGDPAALLQATVGAAASSLAYYAMAVAWRGGMGFGGVKTAGLVGGMLAFVSFPGPFLVTGALAVLCVGAPLVRAHQEAFLPG